MAILMLCTNNRGNIMEYNKLSKKIKIFGDGLINNELVKKYNLQGITLNATLLKKILAPLSVNYKSFVKNLCKSYKIASINLPISTPVLCEGKGIIKQAEQIRKWGENIYVKIPIINTKGNSNIEIIKKVLKKGIQVNITCIFTPEQVRDLYLIKSNTPIIVSVFAGRIADTGIDPCKIIWHIKNMLHDNIEILWASTREIYNIIQAIHSGCDIITISQDILNKVHLLGKDLHEFSRETVQQFQNDSELLAL